MNKDLFKNIFFSALYNRHYSLDIINAEDVKEIKILSDRFLTPHLILKSVNFNNANKELLSFIQEQEKICNLKLILNKIQILKISSIFNENQIKYSLLKGSAINFYNESGAYIRYSRDIDILVDKNDIEKSYFLLRHIGYKYMDKLVSNRAKFMNYDHHLPALTNNEGSIVEIHHRVTKKKNYKRCPLTNKILSERVAFEKDNVISYTSNIENTIAHILYHGAAHHSNEFGPLYLYDIKNLISNNKINKRKLYLLLEKLNLVEPYNEIIKIIKSEAEAKDLYNFYLLSLKKIKSDRTPKSFKWLLLTKSGRIEFIEIIQKKIMSTEDRFQVSKKSPRFYFILLLLLIRHIKRIYFYNIN